MKNIITIGREYGSGGYEIGEKLAEALGYKFYDKELIAAVAEKNMISESFVASIDEVAATRRRNIFIENFPIFNNEAAEQEKYIFNQQGEFIRELAKEGNCIFVGRRADFYLKDNPDAMHLYFYADMEFRQKRISESLGCTMEEAFTKIESTDKKRKYSYEYTTGRLWANPHNYDRMICTSSFGIDKAVEEIVNLIKTQK